MRIVTVLFLCFLLSCSNQNGKVRDDTVNNTSGVTRLMIYYPLDSTDAAGNKLYRVVPDVEFISQDGKPFRTSSVSGKIIINDFFFASCQGICPRMTNQLTRVQDAFRNDTNVKILSFTVDPVRDSSEALRAYAHRFKADSLQWTFLTGEKKKLYDLARYGFFLPVEPGDGSSEDFIHSDQMVLVDRHSHIRGYYTGTDSAAIDSLIVDIRTLLREK